MHRELKNGIMREQSMRYNIKKIFCTTALALVLGLLNVPNVYAQEKIALTENGNDEIPDEISLFGDSDENALPDFDESEDLSLPEESDGALTPAASVSADAPQTQDGGIDGGASVEENGLGGNVSVSDIEIETNQDGIQIPAAQTSAPVVVPQAPLGGQLIEDIDDNVFAKMSDLEKQAAVLTLELRKEKLKNEIEALKSLRAKAVEEERSRIEEEKRKKQEWEKEQERKTLQEQQKLRELEIAYENARQEKIVKAYKTQMLKEKQKWIGANAEVYKEISELKKERQKIINDFKGKFIQLTQLADQATKDAIRVRNNYAKVISDLQTQVSILKARLEATEKANPFADNGQEESDAEETVSNLSDLYAIMEIRGKGEELSAKLINDKGQPFIVKVGTTLQSGHTIDEIASTYVRAVKDGSKEFLYFAAGGVLDKEPTTNEELKIKVSEKPVEAPARSIVSSKGIPSMAREMTIR